MEPKRIILRLRNEDFPLFSNSDIHECIKSFLTFSNRSPDELDTGTHYFHVQPPTTPGGRSHIVIDLEASKHSGSLQSDFPHEIYRILPKDGIM